MLELIQHGLRFPLRVQEIAGPAQMRARGAQRNALFAFRNRRQIEVHPALLLQQMADEIVDVEPLHDDYDGVLWSCCRDG